jgi:hypothetical protein
MPVFTSLWNLLKKNPATDGADTFNIQTMLNDNWDKIDAALGLKAVNADVRAATTANITLSGLQTIDGVALAAGDRVLVKNQTTGSQNGIYTAAEGPWTRASDADVSGKLASGLLVYVKEGSSNGKKQWRLSNTGPITLGTTALTFELVAGAGSATDAVIGNRTITDTTAPAGDSGTLTSLFGWLGYMIKAITGKSSWRTAPATTLEAAKAHMDATAGVHGATSAATAGAIMQRDASGRAKVAAPSAADDIARKAEVDAAIASAAADATNKADAVQANLTAHIGSGGTAHAVATASAAGFMSAADKSKLDGIAAGANNYTHPTGDGNLHVPATGTTNNGKVLKAGSTAGSIAWGNVAFSELTGKPTTLSGYGITDAAPSSHVGAGGTAHAVATTSAAGFMSAADKAKLDGITDGATAGTATPLMDGTAAVGTSTAYAREDHRHPTDTTRAPLASPAFTGTPTAPTAAAGTNNTQIATTAFVNTAIAALPFNMARQAIINGNFDIWQRGNSFSNPANYTFTSDRWQVISNAGGGTLPSLITHAQIPIPAATTATKLRGMAQVVDLGQTLSMQSAKKSNSERNAFVVSKKNLPLVFGQKAILQGRKLVSHLIKAMVPGDRLPTNLVGKSLRLRPAGRNILSLFQPPLFRGRHSGPIMITMYRSFSMLCGGDQSEQATVLPDRKGLFHRGIQLLPKSKSTQATRRYRSNRVVLQKN